MTNILVLKFIFLVSPLTYISVTFCSYEQAYLASILATERGAHWIGLTNRGAQTTLMSGLPDTVCLIPTGTQILQVSHTKW